MDRRDATLLVMASRAIGVRARHAVLAVALVSAATVAAASDAAAIRIRVFDTSGSNPEHLKIALATAGAILLGATIPLSWLDCPAVNAAARDPACGDTPSSRELLLRIARSPRVSGRAPSLRETELGWSLVDVEAATGVLATVFPDRVKEVARAASVDEVTLLGRVIAHEIGHLLLGTAGHGSHGLMRAHWSRAMIRQMAADDWRFTPPEIASMRTGLLARLLPDGDGPTRRARLTPELSSAPCDGSSGVTSTGSSASRSTISSNCY